MRIRENIKESKIVSEKIAYIVGGSSGIGLACSEALAERGYQTVIFAKKEGIDLENLTKNIENRYGVKSYYDYFEISDKIEVHQSIENKIKHVGTPDVLINSAGFNRYEPFLANGMKRQEEIVNVNLLGVMNTLHATLPSMLNVGRGHVINISSMSAKMGSWGHASYSAAKAGVAALTESLAMENEDINFTCVFPGIVRTEFYNKGKYDNFQGTNFSEVIEAKDVAERIVKEIGKKKPAMEIILPKHYKMLDLIKFSSKRLAHKMVSKKSRPLIINE